ncbi:MAG: RHS repeat protein [Lentisphaeria bacterium]|nr:RHS repeat protein [Lentisphaeria bacterium]
MMLRCRVLLCAVLFCAACAFGAEKVSFAVRGLSAGKASLTENGYTVTRTLGTANFSPELRMPVQLIYNSALEDEGAFGYGWSAPQLESSAVPQRDGVLWTTPWGEKIRFYAKQKADRDTLELYREAMKGRSFFTPYADWEADTLTRGDFSHSGDWVFTGEKDFRGWRFTYRDSRLVKAESPKGDALAYVYAGDRLQKVVQNGTPFIELSWSGRRPDAVKINGVETLLLWKESGISVLPKTEQGTVAQFTRPRLIAVRTGSLNPVEFGYDECGYLNLIRQGDFADRMKIQHETLEERRANLRAKADRKAEHSGRVAGRLLEDAFLKYSYSGWKPGVVRLTNRAGERAGYDYSASTGVFRIREFSGKSYTVYYFMRYDVAYLGKVRQIVDGRGRTVVSYRYDKLSGRELRVRDMAGNDVNFAYDKAGNLELVTRRGAEQADPEPVARLAYDAKGNLAAAMRLDARGEAVLTTRLSYDRNGRPVKISDGRRGDAVGYTPFGYVESVRNIFGQAVRNRYDNYNRLVRSVLPNGVETRCEYTPEGLISKVERCDGEKVLTSISVSYDGDGRPVSCTDQQGRVKRFEYDAFGRMVKELLPDETAVEYAYDRVGNLAQVTDQNGHELKFDWSRFGLSGKTTAAGQLTDYVYDRNGLLAKLNSKQGRQLDRSIRYEYDGLDRVAKIDYGRGQVETFRYDSWGKLVEAAKGDKRAVFKYDYFGRLTEKSEEGLSTVYTYDAWGSRTNRVTFANGLELAEKRFYDRYGRLTEIGSDGKSVKYEYDRENRLARQTIDNIPVDYEYTKYGQLAAKYFGGKLRPISTLRYFYAPDGTVAAREVGGKLQRYTYDRRGQLLAVLDSENRPVEQYTYDKAGNILVKFTNGVRTTFTYDKANQLVSSTDSKGVTKNYAYDAAGRLVKEGEKVYQYGWLDKILTVEENGKNVASFDYHMNGQIASAVYGDRKETFLWDGLALIRRDGTNIVNEPAVTGGNPVIAGDKTLFNDILGSTLGAKSGGEFSVIERDAFGQTETASDYDFFTGKPHIGELGYAFLFRNYRANLGKWQTADPMGYPDGWNNLAYVNNIPIWFIDFLGAYRLANGNESSVKPGAYEWTYNFTVASILTMYIGYSRDGLPMLFTGDVEPGGGSRGTITYSISDTGEVYLNGNIPPYSWSGEIFFNESYDDQAFNTYGSVGVSFSPTTINKYDPYGNLVATEYYLEGVFSADIEPTYDDAGKYITFSSRETRLWLLNTVTYE